MCDFSPNIAEEGRVYDMNYGVGDFPPTSFISHTRIMFGRNSLESAIIDW